MKKNSCRYNKRIIIDMEFIMSTSRSSLAQILQDMFKQNPAMETRCLKTSKLALQKKDLGRVFDGFPVLFSSAEFEKLSMQFSLILTQANKEKREAQTILWGRKLVQLAKNELLESNGLLKSHVIAILGWTDYLRDHNQSDANSIVRSYLSTAFQHIVNHLTDIIFKQVSTYHAVLDFFNRNLLIWIRESLVPSTIQEESKQSSLQINGMSLGLGAAVLSGFLIFYASSQKQQKEEHLQQDVAEYKPVFQP